jgi:penicillin-binding protein 2
MSVQLEQGRTQIKNLYRFSTLGLAVIVAVTTLSVQMFQLQVVKPQSTTQITSEQTTTTQAVPSSRGLIYDDAKHLLVVNTPNYIIQIVPRSLTQVDKPAVVRRLATLLNLDPLDIDTALDSTGGSLDNPVTIATHRTLEETRVIEENHDSLPGVQVVVQNVRAYQQGPLFGEILGYTGPINGDDYALLKEQGYTQNDIIGKAGIEQQYEDQLRGKYGSQTVALDSTGRPIPGLVTPITAPVAGSTLTLSLDTKEQQLAQKALAYGLAQAHVKMGVIIVMNPQNGEIKAMVSLPGYDDNIFANGLTQDQYGAMIADPNGPLLNKAVSEQYAPGSTYKLVTGTAGLQDGKITATSTINSVPYVMIDNQPFPEWNGKGWGPLNIISGLAHSSDTFFYQLADKVGLARLAYWQRQYGFGDYTGVDLPQEAKGIVPDDTWKKIALGTVMNKGEIVQSGIGQGFVASTPLQLLNAYCALANGGNLWTPHVVTAITDPEGNVTQVQPKLIRKLPVSDQNLQTMRLATRAVVTSRHTYNLVDMPIMVAGKTGTAEFGVMDRYGRLPYHEWFVGYVPADPYHGSVAGTDSNLAVVAFTYGADTWGDVSTEIVKYYLMLHYGLSGAKRPTSGFVPYHINTWAFKRTNFFGSANNH